MYSWKSNETWSESYTGTILIISWPWDCPHPGTMKARYRRIVLCDYLTGLEAIKLNCPRAQCTELCKLVVRCKYRQQLLINLPNCLQRMLFNEGWEKRIVSYHKDLYGYVYREKILFFSFFFFDFVIFGEYFEKIVILELFEIFSWKEN